MAQEVLTIYHLVIVAHQIFEHVKFFECQRNRNSPFIYFSLNRVELYILDSKHIGY